jgi:hypothetical protein
MDHIARYDRLQRIVAEAAQYRTLREVVRSDPQNNATYRRAAAQGLSGGS